MNSSAQSSIATDFDLPITASFPTEDPALTESLFPAEVLTEVTIGYGVAAFSLLSALFHFLVATVATGGTSLFAASLGTRVALAIGNEGAGISPELAAQATQRVTIPMHAGVESLNVSVAAALLLYEARRQRALRVPD